MGLRSRIAVLVAALWWGSLVAIGGIAVPLLFATLPSASLAGPVAARLFAALNMLAIGCGVLLLLLFKGRAAGVNRVAGAQTVIFAAVLGVLLALLIQFAVAPRIIAGVDLPLWHTLGTVFLVLQWLCAGLILWRLATPLPAPPD